MRRKANVYWPLLLLLSACVTERVILTPPRFDETEGAPSACGAITIYIADDRREDDPAEEVDWLDYDDAGLIDWVSAAIGTAYGKAGVTVDFVASPELADIEISLRHFYLQDLQTTLRTTVAAVVTIASTGQRAAVRGHHAGVVWIGNNAEYKGQLKAALRDFSENLLALYPVCEAGGASGR